MEDFSTEISGSSCSVPSEPPDIRNWFSSYKYESFVLDTCENFGGISSDERENSKDELVIGDDINREKGENFDGSGEISKADEPGNLNSSQDSLHSPSILSEPPHIRNWFSSYVVATDAFKSYISGKSACEKDELVTGESIKDEAANLGQSEESNKNCKKGASEKTCSTELVKCSSSLVDRTNESDSLFSEPPDIGNWFPDYVYESPVLGTSDQFRDTLSMERESNEDKFAVEDSKGEEQENFMTTTKTRYRNEVVVGKKMCSNEFGICDSFPRHDEPENKSISEDLHWTGGSENLSWQVDFCFEKIMDPSLETKQMQSGSSNSNESVEISGFNGGDSISKLERANSQSPHISRRPGKNGKKSLKKLIDRRGSIETKAQTDKVDLASHEQSQRKPTHGSNANDKENEGKDIAENGFITTRKNKFIRANDENSVRVPGEIPFQRSRNKSSYTTGNEKGSVVKRKVLAETSKVNVKQCEVKTMEITGKWRCPQKSKPPRCPPSKQLRLEQWFHRV